MKHNTWIYLTLMILTTNLIRVIPITLIRGKIKNRFLNVRTDGQPACSDRSAQALRC